MTAASILSTLRTDSGDVAILGNITWWNVREVEITREWFKQQLDLEGFDGEKYAKDHNYRSALIRVLKTLEEQRIIRRIKEDNVEISYQFTAEQLIDGETPELVYSKELVISIDKGEYWSTQDIGAAMYKVSNDGIAGKVKQVIIDRFNAEKSIYKSADLTRYIQNILAGNADIVSLREQGSVYFVPAIYQDVVERLARILSRVPKGSAVLQFIPIPDVQSARDAVSDGVTAEAIEVFSKMQEEMQNTSKFSEQWITHRIKVIDKIKDRIGMYESILGSRYSELTGTINKIKSDLGSRKIEV